MFHLRSGRLWTLQASWVASAAATGGHVEGQGGLDETMGKWRWIAAITHVLYIQYIYIIISVVIIMIIIIIILFWLLSTLLLLYYCFSSGISDSWTNKHCGFIWFMSHCCLGWWVSPLMANKTGPRGYMSYERVKPWCLNGTWMTTDLEMFWSKAVVRGEWHSYELLILTIW